MTSKQDISDKNFIKEMYKRLDGYPLGVNDKKGNPLFLGDSVQFDDDPDKKGKISYSIFKKIYYIHLYYSSKHDYYDIDLGTQEELLNYSDKIKKLDYCEYNFYDGCKKTKSEVSYRNTCMRLLTLYYESNTYFTREELERIRKIEHKYTDIRIVIDVSIAHIDDTKTFDKNMKKLKEQIEDINYNQYFKLNKSNVKIQVLD